MSFICEDAGQLFAEKENPQRRGKILQSSNAEKRFDSVSVPYFCICDRSSTSPRILQTAISSPSVSFQSSLCLGITSQKAAPVSVWLTAILRAVSASPPSKKRICAHCNRRRTLHTKPIWKAAVSRSCPAHGEERTLRRNNSPRSFLMLQLKYFSRGYFP